MIINIGVAMAASDVFFLPSKMEGLSIAFIEAMSMGLTVVGSDVGGQGELVDEHSGVLLPFPPSATIQQQALGYAIRQVGSYLSFRNRG